MMPTTKENKIFSMKKLIGMNKLRLVFAISTLILLAALSLSYGAESPTESCSINTSLGKITVPVDFAKENVQPGNTFKIWVETKSASQFSLSATLGSNCYSKSFSPTNSSSYQWVSMNDTPISIDIDNIQSLSLMASSAGLNVRNVIITTDMNCIPTGVQPTCKTGSATATTTTTLPSKSTVTTVAPPISIVTTTTIPATPRLTSPSPSDVPTAVSHVVKNQLGQLGAFHVVSWEASKIPGKPYALISYEIKVGTQLTYTVLTNFAIIIIDVNSLAGQDVQIVAISPQGTRSEPAKFRLTSSCGQAFCWGV